MYSTTVLVGRAAAPPELKYSQSGIAIATVSVAEDRGKDETCWWRVTLWRAAGESAAQHIKKGDPIIVEGKATAHAWIGADGDARSQLELSANIWRFAGGSKRDDAPNEGTQPKTNEPEDLPF